MRIKKALKNSLYSASSYLILLLAGLFIRKLFISNFSEELLGYESLFGSVFLALSIADMGAGSMFNYMLYRAISKSDDAEIGILMQMFRQLYFFSGIVVAAIGGVLFFFLPAYVHAENANWSYVRLVYCIQMFTTLSSYFLSYRRAIFVANQCEYKAIKIETDFRLISALLRVCAILLVRSYVAYLLCSLFCNIAANTRIWFAGGKEYPHVFSSRKPTIEDYRKREIFNQIRPLFLSKIASTIWSSSDNILISAILGIHTTTLYGFYTMIYNPVITCISKFMQPIYASVGNLIYNENVDKSWKFYNSYDLFFGFLASFCFVSFVVLFQPFLKCVYGEQYLLPFTFVIAFSANGYIAIKQSAVTAFRNGMGNYAMDQNFWILSAVVNIVLSIALAKPLGITGISAATALAHLFIWIGRLRVVCASYFHCSILRLAAKEIGWIFVTIFDVTAVLWLCKDMPFSIAGIGLRAVLCILVTNCVNILIFFRSKSFSEMCSYGKTAINLLMDSIR